MRGTTGNHASGNNMMNNPSTSNSANNPNSENRTR
jgi:hypothetical protein